MHSAAQRKPLLRCVYQQVVAVAAWLCCTLSATGHCAEARLAVAANFLHTAKTLASDFEDRSGHQLLISSGSSGQLLAKILHGADFDLFLSADHSHVRKLAEQQSTPEHAIAIYACGRLALASRDHPVDASLLTLAGRFPDTARMAIANPRTAPYGAAAAETLEKPGALAALSGQLIYGQNVNQAFHYVVRGEVDYGIVALSQLLALRQWGNSPTVNYLPVSTTLHSPIKQTMALTETGKENPVAREFFAFMQSPGALSIIRQAGYALPVEGCAQ